MLASILAAKGEAEVVLSGILPVSDWNSQAKPYLFVPACGLFAYSDQRAF